MAMKFSLQMGGIAVEIDAAGQVRLAIPSGAQTLTSHEFMVLAKILESAAQLALPPVEKPVQTPEISGLSVTIDTALTPPPATMGAPRADAAAVPLPCQPGRQLPLGDNPSAIAATPQADAPDQLSAADATAVPTVSVAPTPEPVAAENVDVAATYTPAKPAQLESPVGTRVAGRPLRAVADRAVQSDTRLGGANGSKTLAKTRSATGKGRPRGPDALPTAVRWPEFSNIGRRPGRITVAGRAILPGRAAVATGPRNPGRSSTMVIAREPISPPAVQAEAVAVAAPTAKLRSATIAPPTPRPAAPVAQSAPAQTAPKAEFSPSTAAIAAPMAAPIATPAKVVAPIAAPSPPTVAPAQRTPLMQGREFAALVVEWMAKNPGPRTQDEIVLAAQIKGWTTRENARHLVETSLPRYREIFARHVDGTLQRRADFLPNVVVAGKVHRRRPDGTPSSV